MKAIRTCLALLFIFGTTAIAAAQDPAEAWKALQQPTFDPSRTATAEGVTITRDRICITLTNGTIQLTKPVNGIVFGAAFHGTGRVQVDPPNPLEAQQLRLFTGKDTLDIQFSDATFLFSDSTFDEIAAQVKWAAQGPGADESYAKRQQEREDLGAEILPRLYKGILSADHKRTAFFLADLKTKEKGWVEFQSDALSPEEITVGRWAEVTGGKTFDIWMSFPAGGRNAADAWHAPQAKDDVLFRSYKVDTTVTGGAELTATARVTVEPQIAGERVLVFLLDSNLRADKVTDETGHALTFIQARERKDRSQSYGEYIAVVLAEPTQTGKNITLEFHYSGKRVVRQVGPGNYFCQSFGWYPTRENSFASRADFELNFRVPKRYSLVATGDRVSQTIDGDWNITSWKSGIPLAVAGFAFGDYKVYTEKAGNVDVEVYANREPDDFMRSILHITEGALPGESSFGMPALGTLSPASLAKQIATEMGNTLRLFEAYFGPYPYKHLAVANIPYSYGQGWPNLIYLSMLSFLDGTQRNALGITAHTELTDFFRAHESSHQWWGHRVGWKSYHDQWLSEGFAEFSGNLYVQYRQNIKEYRTQLEKNRRQIWARDAHNHVYDLVGPIWMGSRLDSSESPRTNEARSAYEVLVYAKGGYVLHMLRWMLYDPRNAQNPEARFQAMMQEFCKTYDNKAASTEDFKAVAEKYMTPSMDVEQNHRLDWFFRQYVYGMGIPRYNFSYQVEDVGGGKFKVSGWVRREGVPDNWVDILPLYLHRGNGSMRIGFINALKTDTPFEFVLRFKPEKFTINDNDDILADIKQ